MDRADLRAALTNKNVKAFLRVIRAGESSQNDSAYTIQFGGGHFAVPPWEHPQQPVTAGALTSSAAGAYQFLSSTWLGLVRQYGFGDFSPACQDEAAVALIHGRKALADVIAGRFEAALAKCAKEWASLPGSPYGQPTIEMERAQALYIKWGGTFDAHFDPDSLDTEHYEGPEPYRYTPKEKPKMAFPLIPLLTAFGPKLVELIPQLGAMFGSGSDVQTRNVKALTAVVETVVQATGQPNLQAAIETMEANPDVAKAARAEVAEVMALMEVGGGIEAARKAAGDPGQSPPWKNPAVWFWVTVLPIVYAGTAAVLFAEVFGLTAFSNEVRMMVLTAIFTGMVGAASGFFLGSSLGSQSKDQRSRQFGGTK